MAKSFQSGVGFMRWRDSTGRVLHMEEMDDRYLQNALKKCIEFNNGGKAREIRACLTTRNKPNDDPPYDLGDWT